MRRFERHWSIQAPSPATHTSTCCCVQQHQGVRVHPPPTAAQISDALTMIIGLLPPPHRKQIEQTLMPQNSRITDLNVVLAAVRGCNTAVYVLSCEVAASVATTSTS